MAPAVGVIHPATGKEDKNMKNETRNDEAVSPVIATILMVAITVVLAGVLYVWAANLAESNTSGDFEPRSFEIDDHPDNTGKVIVTMTSGADLSWSGVVVTASVDGLAADTLGECDAQTTENCWTKGNDNDATAWNVGEAVTIDTSCTGTCTVVIKVIDNRADPSVVVYNSPETTID